MRIITKRSDEVIGDDSPETPVGSGVKSDSGNWLVRVTDKNAAYNQRVMISNAEEGSGNFKASSKTQDVVSSGKWTLNIQNDGGKGQWKDSSNPKDGGKGKFILN